MCGEQSADSLADSEGNGSSPRVRGTVCVGSNLQAACRFIPACAGNRLHTRHLLTSRPVHPRVCGEQTDGRRTGLFEVGSSPRVRGTDSGSGASRGRWRFIPACAGNRINKLRIITCYTVHPRVCGEQSSPITIEPGSAGSSPRVRGTESIRRLPPIGDRFIPACAGNRKMTSIWQSMRSVHPRVCGEQSAVLPDQRPINGSSPRVRGTDFNGGSVASAGRFIPACAGNSSLMTGWGSIRTVHPRVCGEQCVCVCVCVCGSSPRVRGTALDRKISQVGLRFIPACAGNSRNLSSPSTTPAVHPRVCGEQRSRRARI